MARLIFCPGIFFDRMMWHLNDEIYILNAMHTDCVKSDKSRLSRCFGIDSRGLNTV